MTASELEKLLADAGAAMDGLHRISAEDWGVDMPGDGGWVFVGKRENAPRLIVIETGFGSSADRRQDAIERLCILAPVLARRVIAAEKLVEALRDADWVIGKMSAVLAAHSLTGTLRDPRHDIRVALAAWEAAQ